ncbi:unnamed protein product [Linum trigynum]|uniref:DUF4283 domain-containing protein n=1 Tax=Linum trigynum TaxID=586398 RepID=A0AAV2D9J4_9ROSI
MRLAPKWVYITTNRRLDPTTERLENTAKKKSIPGGLAIPSDRGIITMIQMVILRLYFLWLTPHIGAMCFIAMFRIFTQHFQVIEKIETMLGEPMDADQIVEFELDDVENNMRRAKLSLIGRLFMDNPPSLKTIQKIVQGEWGCSSNVTVIEAELGLLQFLFNDERDKDWVL